MTEVRPAATVVLLRDNTDTDGVQAWLLRRVKQMAFAPGMTVFPGGRVDPSDTDGIEWTGGTPADVARRFGVDESTARGALTAAARETFEETGVLLTSPPADLVTHRAAVEQHRTSFTALLGEHDLRIDAAAIRPWGRWITPAGESRRYDTFFFVAALPPDATAMDETSEATDATWVDVSTALAEYADGSRPMLPPTVHTLRAVGEHATVADVLAAADRRHIEAISPDLRRTAAGGLEAVLPDGEVLPLPGRTA